MFVVCVSCSVVGYGYLLFVCLFWLLWLDCLVCIVVVGCYIVSVCLVWVYFGCLIWLG